MKQRILYILLLITTWIGGTNVVWGQTTSYVCDDSSEREWSTISNSGNYNLTGPAKTLTFQAKRTAILGISNDKNFYAEYSTDGGNTWNRVLKLSLPERAKWYSFSCEIPENANRVRMITETGATGNKQVRNVSVTRATTLSAPASVDMSGVKIGKSVSTTFDVDFNNTTYPQELTGSCTNNAFTVDGVSLGETGTAQIGITFAPTEAGNHSGTVTLKMGTASTTFTVSGVAADKGTPAFTWSLANIATGREYTDFFTTTNEDCAVTFTSSDESVAKVVDGVLCTFSKEGQATITVTQAGNDDWHSHQQSYTVTVSKPQNHLPLSISDANWSILAKNIKGGSYKWDGGIQHHSLAYSDREFEIAFTGIPDKLSFNHRVTDSNIDDEVRWSVKESSDGNSFEETWSTKTNNGSAQVQLKPTTRYVRIFCRCIYYENVSNIHISELSYFTSNATDMSFGENIQDDAVTPKTFTISHCNAGFGATIVSSNPENFSVSPSELTSTGGDKMGEETITVTYLNKNVGEHTGTITISDPNGSNSPISFNVSGSTLSHTLVLDPSVAPSYDIRVYKKARLNRTIPAGLCTLTIPFNYNISGIPNAYAAQLALVTYNQNDGYTLYFERVADGQMLANQPYVVYLPEAIPNPEWSEFDIEAPNAGSVTTDRTQGWTMCANYTPGVSMEGKYGIAGGKMCLGAAGSTINAYTAYFVPPTASGARVRMAVKDGDVVTYIGSVQEAEGYEKVEVFRLDGTRQSDMTKGINIIRMEDGTVRKVFK